MSQAKRKSRTVEIVVRLFSTQRPFGFSEQIVKNWFWLRLGCGIPPATCIFNANDQEQLRVKDSHHRRKRRVIDLAWLS
jgi:hypothetical protein